MKICVTAARRSCSSGNSLPLFISGSSVSRLPLRHTEPLDNWLELYCQAAHALEKLLFVCPRCAASPYSTFLL